MLKLEKFQDKWPFAMWLWRLCEWRQNTWKYNVVNL